MRRLATLLLGIALLTPGLASARQVGGAECRHLTTQIEYFEGRVAKQRALDNNEVWEARLENHLAALEQKREDRCPGYSDTEEALRFLQRLAMIAAKGAVTFFTLGAF